MKILVILLLGLLSGCLDTQGTEQTSGVPLQEALGGASSVPTVPSTGGATTPETSSIGGSSEVPVIPSKAVVFVLDRSEAVSNYLSTSDSTQWSAIREGLKAYLNKHPEVVASISVYPPLTGAECATNYSTVDVEFTRDRNILGNFLDSVQSGGSTIISPTLYTGVTFYESYLGKTITPLSLVLIAGGAPEEACTYPKNNPNTIEGLIDLGTDVPVSVLAVGKGKALQVVSAAGGGRNLHQEEASGQDITKMLEAIIY